MKKTLIICMCLIWIGCASIPKLQTVTLQCKDPYEAESFIGFYSFTAGVLTAPPEPDQIDIVYYFDSDDCSEGILLGHYDVPGYIFPIGYKSWKELIKLKPPLENEDSAIAIEPLTKDKEGLAFWVKTNSGEYFLVKIKSIQPATYSDLASGNFPTLEFEWFRTP